MCTICNNVLKIIAGLPSKTSIDIYVYLQVLYLTRGRDWLDIKTAWLDLARAKP